MTKWKTYKISDIGRVVTGKTPKTSILENYGGDIPFLTPSDDLSGKYSPATAKTLTQLGLSEVKNCLLPANSICVSCIGSDLGKVVKTIQPTVTNQQFNSIIPNGDFDTDFIYYLMTIVGKQLNYLSKTSTAVPIINKTQFSNFDVKIPSLEEQRRIAGILGVIDDKIENNRRINANLELQAQALFENLMSNSNLEYKLIADINHTIETGRRPKGGVANITCGVPSIGAENVKGLGKYDYSKTKYITTEFAETLKKGIIKGYELLIYKDGGKPGYFIPNFSIFGEGFPYDDMTLNEHVFLLDFGSKGYNFFAYFYMQTEEVMKYLNAQGSKAAIPGINRNDVESISIPTIKNNVVKEFCSMVEPIITSILVNSKESSRLAILRDTLLPKLMNGEIKL